MNMWEHLFLTGEFPPRERLLSGLTLEQVARRPPGASHSIYEELWHAATWQRAVVERAVVERAVVERAVVERAAVEGKTAAGSDFPSAPPEREEQWNDVVRLFLDGARAAVALAASPERLAREIEPGVTMADELHGLALHNAYHLGKIVALRQLLGAWPPKPATS